MSDIKSKAQGIEANLSARDVEAIAATTGNIYEALNVIASRSKQLSVDLKTELHKKLEDFAIVSETIEEIHENKEQIEISKFYERLPNPTLIATMEFINGELDYRKREELPDAESTEDLQ